MTRTSDGRNPARRILFRTAWLFSLAMVFAGSSVMAQDPPDRASELRHLYLLRDYEGAIIKGKEWLEQTPDAAELRAWYVLNLARHMRESDALEMAEAMVEADPENPWSVFALAGALNWQNEGADSALGVSEAALRAMPNDLDFAWLRTECLRKQDGNEMAIAFMDSLPEEVGRHPNLLVRRGVALQYQWDELEDEEKDSTLNLGYAAFEEARTLDPANVEAYYLPAAYHMIAGRNDSSLILLEQAAALTPSPEVHQLLWRIIRAGTETTREAKQAAIESDIEALLSNFDEAPGTLQAVASIYGELDLDDKKLELEERVLSEYPTSEAAEQVLVNRYRALSREIYDEEQLTGVRDSAKDAQFRAMVEAFIERPQHQSKRLLGDAYRQLFQIVDDDPDVDGDYLYSLVDGMVQSGGVSISVIYGRAPIALAEHHTHFEDAERLAKEGIEKTEEMYRGRAEYYDTEEDLEKAVGRATSVMYDALGWVYFHADRLDEAEQQLYRAYELNEKNRTILHHLGQYHELRAELAAAASAQAVAEDHLDQAESFYIKGVMVQGFTANPNDDALRNLYVTRNGSDEGFDEYLAGAESLDAEIRREELLGTMIEEPDTVAAFSLQTLDSSTVAYEDLRGKVVAVNFWGVWCGPCVVEMPEIQKLHERYADDPDVAILTIDYQDDVDELREWLDERDYTFPVLLDDGYVGEAEIRGFPTTWFIGRDGRIMFVKLGSSAKLDEEFSWRIEALREMGNPIP